jgi:hypothetical protein
LLKNRLELGVGHAKAGTIQEHAQISIQFSYLEHSSERLGFFLDDRICEFNFKAIRVQGELAVFRCVRYYFFLFHVALRRLSDWVSQARRYCIVRMDINNIHKLGYIFADMLGRARHYGGSSFLMDDSR